MALYFLALLFLGLAGHVHLRSARSRAVAAFSRPYFDLFGKIAKVAYVVLIFAGFYWYQWWMALLMVIGSAMIFGALYRVYPAARVAFVVFGMPIGALCVALIFYRG